MAEEGADLVGCLGGEDVFELAGLLLDLGLARLSVKRRSARR